MARQILPIAGALVGAYFGNPQLGYAIGSIIGNAVDPQIIKGPSIGDGVTQTSREGVPRSIIYGTGNVSGNLIDQSKVRKWKKRTRQGKGGPVNEEERMSKTFAIRVCEGPIAGVLRIWEDEKLVYDVRENSEILADSSRYAENFRFYNGTEDQMPDPALELIHGAGNTPAYRGTAYIVFDDIDLTDRRGSVPNYRFEVASDGELGKGFKFSNSRCIYDFNEDTETLSFERYIKWSDDDINNIYYKNIPRINVSTPASGPLSNHAYSMSFDGQYYAAVFRIDDYNSELKIRREVVVDDLVSFEDCIIPDLGSKPMSVCFSPIKNIAVVICKEKAVILRANNNNFEITSEKEFSPRMEVVDYYYGDGSGSYDNLNPIKGIQLKFNREGTRIFFAGIYVDVLLLDYHTFAGDLEVTSSNTFNNSVNNFIRVVDSYPILDSNVISSNYFKRNLDFAYNNLNFCLATFGTDFGPSIFYTKTVQGAPSRGAQFVGFNPSRAATMCFLPDNNVLMFDGFKAYILYTEVNIDMGVTHLFFNNNYKVLWEDTYIVINDVQIIRKSDYHLVVINTLSSQFSSSELIVYKYKDEELTLISSESGQGAGSLDVTRKMGGLVGSKYLHSIIEDVTERVGINRNYIDTSNIQDVVVKGFVLSGDYPANNVIRSLQDSFLFDISEYDDKVHFVKRGGPIVDTIIDYEDLIDDNLEENRESSREYPKKLELFYQNPDVGYAPMKATAERISDEYKDSGPRSLTIPTSFNVDEAAKVADIQMKLAWEEAKGDVILRVTSDFDHLTTSDCIAFYKRDVGHRLRIYKTEKSDGIITLTCKHDRESAYRSNVVGLPVLPPTVPPSSITGPTVFQFLNIPALIDTLDPALHYYYGASGFSDAWYGAVVERKVDDDEFEEVSRVSMNSRMGRIVNALPFSSEHYPDTTNDIIVKMFREDDNIDSVSMSQLLREKNSAAISRSDGTAELIQFRDVEELGDNEYKLSYILRGRLNSHSSHHDAEAVFTILDDVSSVTFQPALINATVEHRATSFNESVEDSLIHINSLAPPLSQLEWPVALLKASQSAGMINVTWSARERFGTDVTPIRSVNWQAYRITAIDANDNVFTVDSFNNSVSIDATNMSFPVIIEVQQVNRYTGSGPKETVIVNI